MGHVKRLIALTAAAAVMLVGLISVAAAQSGEEQADESAPVKVVSGVVKLDEGEFPADAKKDGEFLFEGGECFGEWEPPEEEIAEINAEHDALVAYLEGLGFTVTVATDELGIRYIDFKAMGDDEALFEAMEDFYKSTWAEEFADWSDEEKAEHNAYIEELVADLAAKGITVETEEIAPGVIDIVWTEEVERALMEVEGDEVFFGDFEEEWEPSANEIAEINAEHQALVAHLAELGFAVSVATDELGIRYIDFEAHGDDEALWTAVDEYYQADFANDIAGWSDEEKAEWNAHIEEFVADLAAKGITVETEEIAPGVYDIVWTEEIDLALMELEGEDFPFGDDECFEWLPGPDEIAEINDETEALVAHLEGLGYAVTVAEDELGIRYVDFEAMDDDEALWEAVDTFYHQRFVDEIAGWSDAEKAEWNNHIDEMVADLAAKGITVETEEIAPGVYDIVWTEDVEAKFMKLEGGFFFGDVVKGEVDIDA